MSEIFTTASKGDFFREGQNSLSNDDIKVGCLQRIASATELMAKNHQQLIDERDKYKRWYEVEAKDNKRMARRIAAFQGIIKKLKNK